MHGYLSSAVPLHYGQWWPVSNSDTVSCGRSEPEALPFCALAYSLIGIISTLLVSIPPIAAALLKITAA